MAIDKTASNTRGRNVEPRSSILDMQTLDVDASGFTVPPEDGEWLFFEGALQAATHDAADLTTAKALQLCMVWSEAGRSDLQATNRERVPVIFRHSFHCELQLYNYDAAALPQSGWVLLVGAAKVAINGDSGLTRLVAEPTDASGLGAGTYWIVGNVLKSLTKEGDPLEVMIFDTPQMLTV